MKKLHTILLIDDDKATNFIHKFVLEKENCAENIVSIENGPEALIYLKTKINGNFPHPELIFLDINMPGMNGWEFLEEYEKIDQTQKAKKIVVMLTTSTDPFDRKKAESINHISAFQSKPLTAEKIHQILLTNFPDIFNK